MARSQVWATVDTSTLLELESMAKSENLKLSDYIRKILTTHVNTANIKKKKKGAKVGNKKSH